MLLSFRRTAIAEIDASVATKALVHTRYRVHVIHNRNVVCEDELFLPAMERIGRVSRPVLTVVLAGRARLRLAGGFERWLEPGDLALMPQKAAVAMRQEGTPFRSIAIEWDPGTLGASAPAEPDCGSLDAQSLLRVLAIATELEACTKESAAAILLTELVVLLRAQGARFERFDPGALVEKASGSVARLSRALDAVLSQLAGGPAMADLDEALGLSPRQINRIVGQFNERYGFNSSGWRDTRNRRRLLVGASMMTAPGAKTELVARAMGYSSPTGFCHAFDASGLPSPGTTAEIVAKLR